MDWTRTKRELAGYSRADLQACHVREEFLLRNSFNAHVINRMSSICVTSSLLRLCVRVCVCMCVRARECVYVFVCVYVGRGSDGGKRRAMSTLDRAF